MSHHLNDEDDDTCPVRPCELVKGHGGEHQWLDKEEPEDHDAVTERWWQVFVAVLNPACRPWLKERHANLLAERDQMLALEVSDAVKITDAAVDAAKRAGRL